MTKSARLQWISQNGWRATRAIHAITQAKRQRNSDYDERIRALRGFLDVLRVKEADAQQLEMFEPEEVLSADLLKLIDAPLVGLD